jgi:cell division protein FtsN
MKNKDYVGQKKNKAKRPKAQQAPKKPFPILKIAIMLALIGAFVFGLNYIKNDSKEFSPEPEVIKKKQKQKPLPPPPENEEWQFIEELENKNVEVETEELEDKGPFKMQCASFRNQGDAESLKARIAFAGFESQIIPSQGTSGLWFKVVLGPYDKKRDAEKTRHVLRRNDINTCEIWLWR